MNATRFTTALFLLLALAGCSGAFVGYSPQECAGSCDEVYRECLRNRPDDPARDAQCLQQRERCLGACLATPCDAPSCEEREAPTRPRECRDCDAVYRECLRGRPDDPVRATHCLQQREGCLERCEDGL